MHNLLLVFLRTRFRLHPFNRPVPFPRWEFLACKCFPWTGSWSFAQPPTWRTRWFFSRFSSSSFYRSLCQPQGSGTGFGLSRVFYFTGTLPIWRAFPYPPPGEAPDGRPVTPHGHSFCIKSAKHETLENEKGIPSRVHKATVPFPFIFIYKHLLLLFDY